MARFQLLKLPIGNLGKFLYTIINLDTGLEVARRKSDRHYVAATSNGEFFFGRLDLIGGGDHGKQIKYAQGWGRDYSKPNSPLVAGLGKPDPERLAILESIAYLDEQIIKGDPDEPRNADGSPTWLED